MIIALRVVQSNALWEAGHAISLISNDMSAFAVWLWVQQLTKYWDLFGDENDYDC